MTAMPIAASTVMAYTEKAVYCGEDRFNNWDVGKSNVRGPKVDASRVRFVSQNFTQAAAGVGRMLDPPGCFVAMRGTLGTVNSLFDAMFWRTSFGRRSCPGCEVEYGFLQCYEAIRPGVFEALLDLGCREEPLYLVGHSMGAAGITYAFFDAVEAGYRVAAVYAMESPRPGNLAFSRAVQARANDVAAWRVSHYRDIVVHLPPAEMGFAHALDEIYYTHRAGTGYEECGVESPNCSEQWWPWQWSFADHEWYADVNPCSCPATALTFV